MKLARTAALALALVHLPAAPYSRLAFILIAMISSGATNAGNAGQPNAQLRTFSNIQFNRIEGDFYGLEVTFVPYTGGTYLLWRAASSRVEPPRLVEAIPNQHGWTIQMPADDDSPGTWVLQESGQYVVAKSPNGNTTRMKRR